MRSFNSKKPAELSFPILEKKPPQLKLIIESDNSPKLIPTRNITNLTSRPLSKRYSTPLNVSRLNKSQKPEDVTTKTPKKSKNNNSATKCPRYKKPCDIVIDEPRVFTEEGDLIMAKDLHFSGDEYQNATSTKCTEKDSEILSLNEEEEKEREKIQNQLGIYGVRPETRAISKYKERFAQFARANKMKCYNNEETKVTFPETEASDNRDTLRSTVIIAESPTENDDNTQSELSNGNSETVVGDFAKDDAKRTLSDAATDITKPSERYVTPRASKKKVQINLEIYLAIENLLRVSKQTILKGQPAFEAFREYIDLAPKKDLEYFEKISNKESEVKLIRSSFILERLAIVFLLYFTQETKRNKKVEQLIKALIELVHENCMLFGYFVSQKLKGRSAENVWIEKLLGLVENDKLMLNNKEKCLEKMQKNNAALITTMKTLIVVLQNKEVMYGFNSVVVQLDRIPIKEAYTRLVKCLSVYMSEQELKSQDPKYQYKLRKFSKEEKLTRIESAKLKEQRRGTAQEIEVEKKPESKKEIKEEENQFYLPKLEPEKAENTYTLVMDLDETLVHFAEIPGHHNELRVRPYVDYFLTEVSKYYEVVVFTTGVQDYADWVLDNIDKNHSISHRLYRHHASTDPDTFAFIKDLSKLGRDLSKVLIVDNLPENFKLQPDNGIAIKAWYDDHEDTALTELAPILVEIAKKKVSDVRETLRRFREQMIENIENGCENPHLNITLN